MVCGGLYAGMAIRGRPCSSRDDVPGAGADAEVVQDPRALGGMPPAGRGSGGHRQLARYSQMTWSLSGGVLPDAVGGETVSTAIGANGSLGAADREQAETR